PGSAGPGQAPWPPLHRTLRAGEIVLQGSLRQGLTAPSSSPWPVANSAEGYNAARLSTGRPFKRERTMPDRTGWVAAVALALGLLSAGAATDNRGDIDREHLQRNW